MKKVIQLKMYIHSKFLFSSVKDSSIAVWLLFQVWNVLSNRNQVFAIFSTYDEIMSSDLHNELIFIESMSCEIYVLVYDIHFCNFNSLAASLF